LPLLFPEFSIDTWGNPHYVLDVEVGFNTFVGWVVFVANKLGNHRGGLGLGWQELLEELLQVLWDHVLAWGVWFGVLVFVSDGSAVQGGWALATERWFGSHQHPVRWHLLAHTALLWGPVDDAHNHAREIELNCDVGIK
jgi:hypothetical protein